MSDLAASVLEASLRASLALALVLGARRIAANRVPAAARHALLFVALLGVALLPIALRVLPGWEVARVVGAEAPASAGPRAPTTAGPPFLTIVWMAGALALGLRLLSGYCAVRRLRTRARPLEAAGWRRPAARAAARLGLGRMPKLLIAPDEVSPMTWGILRPIVLLPASAAGWPPDRRYAVLAHELAHARRAEPLCLLLVEVVRALHWFNPLVWLAAGRLRREAELAADALALDAGIGPADYAAHLVAAIRGSRVAPVAVGLGSNRALRERVTDLLRPGGPRRGAGRLALAALGLAAVLATAVPRVAGQEAAEALAARHGIPVELADSILAAAAREGIAPEVAFGLVRVESGFDPRRVSGGGAIGLTQILPSTAARVEPGVPPAALFDPATNLRVGFRYLRGMLDREGGDVRSALFAYALGPRRLDELRRAGHAPDSDYPDRVLEPAAPDRGDESRP